MVKRPFIWILLFFMIGIVCNKYICSILEFIPLFLISCILCFLFYHFLIHKYFVKTDIFLLFLPFVLCFGFFLPSYLLSGNQLTSTFLKRNIVLEGKIINILEKSSYQEIYLSDICITKGKESVSLTQLLWQDTSLSNLTIGDKVMVEGEITEFDAAANPGQYDGKSYYEAKGICYRMWEGKLKKRQECHLPIYRWLKMVRNKISTIYDTVLEEEDSQVLHAMVLGDKSELGAELKSLYQKAGISHILAISGLHISMIGLFLFQFLKKMGLHHNLASILCILFIYLYGIMTGFSVSTNRAVVMMALSLSACLFHRSYDSMSAVALSGFLVLLQQPCQMFQCGFLLSYLAVIGVILFYPVCKEYFQWCFPDFERHMQMKKLSEYHSLGVMGNKITKLFRESLLVSGSIQLVTLPVLVWFYYEFASLSPIINLFILPFTSLLMLLGILIAVVGAVWLPAAYFLSGSVHYILRFYQLVCTAFQKIPFNRVLTGRPEGWQVVVMTCCIIVFYLSVKYQIHKLCGGILFFGLAVLLWNVPVSGLQITMLDVGQGDGIFMENEDGITCMIDGGSTDTNEVGTYRILPFLKYSGVAKLDYCFLTHMDEDHISGVRELFENALEAGEIQIKTLVLPHTNMVDEAYKEMVRLAVRAGTKVVYFERGSQLKAGKMRLKCLHPYYEFPAEDRNAYSQVLELVYGKFAMLLTGDVEDAGEKAVLQDHLFSTNQYDILKVAHHGSKYSTSTEWLKQVNPKLALLSFGAGNWYGHPHAELLERLNEFGAAIRTTSECGAIEIQVKGEKMYIRPWKDRRTVSVCNLE